MNEEMTSKIDAIIEELNKINADYQQKIDDKSKELNDLISSERTTIKSLSDEIGILNKTIEECQKALQESRTSTANNNEAVDKLHNRFSEIGNTVSSLEERLSNLSDSSRQFLEAKQSLDSFLLEQSKVKVEISAAQARLKECEKSIDEEYRRNNQNKDEITAITNQIDSLKQSDLYKVLVEGNADLKKRLMEEILDYIIENAQVKNAAFKSKLDIEKKG